MYQVGAGPQAQITRIVTTVGPWYFLAWCANSTTVSSVTFYATRIA